MSHIILGSSGITSTLDIDLIAALDICEDVKRIQEPYKNANRKFHPRITIIPSRKHPYRRRHADADGGACSVETPEQIVSVAKSVAASGAHHAARRGVQAPHFTYAFQGLGAGGINCLNSPNRKRGCPS